MNGLVVAARLRAEANHPMTRVMDSLCLHGLANVIERDVHGRAYLQMVFDCFLDLLDEQED